MEGEVNSKWPDSKTFLESKTRLSKGFAGKIDDVLSTRLRDMKYKI